MFILKHSFTQKVKRSLLGFPFPLSDNQVMLELDKTKVAERLRQAMREAGVSNTALSEATGVSVQAVGFWLKTGKISRDRLPQIAKAVRRTVDWLLTGKDSMERELTEKHNKLWATNVEPITDVISRIPLISWMQAGKWEKIMDSYRPEDVEEMVMIIGRVGSHAFALRLEGDSMIDPSTGKGFPPGALLIVDPDEMYKNGSYAVVRLENAEETMFKQLVIEGGKQYLKPINPRYPIIEINSHATICGVVKRFILEASFD